MKRSIAKTRELIDLLISKKPMYADILRFYGQIAELQSTSFTHIYLKLPSSEQDVMQISQKEGFPLMNREEFLIDIPASSALFEALINTAKHANDKMRTCAEAIEDAFAINALRRDDLIRHYADDAYLETVMRDFDVDRVILKFLIHHSVYPSLHAQADVLKDQINLKQWLRGYCPVCGSTPLMSQFLGGGQRSYLCSFCGCEWFAERLKCPFCENTDHAKLHYFYEEGDESHRVELCDACKHYIKTVDTRKLDYEPDLQLEDIITIHLDILASEKGYKRPATSPWRIQQ